MKPKDRIKEINLEISKLLKNKSNPKKLESLQAELKELLIKKRLPPTMYEFRKVLEKNNNLIDFQKEKSARDFSKSIENESLYEELRPKKKGLTDNIITL